MQTTGSYGGATLFTDTAYGASSEVVVLVNEVKSPDSYTATSDAQGSACCVYSDQLRTKGRTITMKIILIS